MMSFYFIDDDKNICNILKLIINERGHRQSKASTYVA